VQKETSLMKNSSREGRNAEKPALTVGIDLGDRFSRYCVVNEAGEVMEEGRIATTAGALERHFAGEARQRIAVECGTHSAWVSRLLRKLGHEVWVANTRKIRAITGSESKNDRNDAEKLARFAAHDPQLLSPIRHRSLERQRDLDLLHARDALVRARTMLVNAARGMVKSSGHRLPKCSTESFAKKARTAVPAGYELAMSPLLEQVAALTEQIRGMDKQIEGLGRKYPEVARLRSVPGVGPVIAAAYVLTLDSPALVASSRAVGAFLGLRPRQAQSGERDPQRRISKTGNEFLRRLLVQAAQYTLGPFAPDSQLRRWGLKLAASGGKRGKKRAVVAVARKLAVLLHCLWRSVEYYRPFPSSAQTAA
jgi:transposase